MNSEQARKHASQLISRKDYVSAINVLAPLASASKLCRDSMLLYERALHNAGRDEEAIDVLQGILDDEQLRDQAEFLIRNRFRHLIGDLRKKRDQARLFEALRRWATLCPLEGEAVAPFAAHALRHGKFESAADCVIAAASAGVATSHPAIAWFATLASLGRGDGLARKWMDLDGGRTPQLWLFSLVELPLGSAEHEQADLAKARQFAQQVETDLSQAGLPDRASAFLKRCACVWPHDRWFSEKLASSAAHSYELYLTSRAKIDLTLSIEHVHKHSDSLIGRELSESSGQNSFRAQLSTFSYPARHDHIFNDVADHLTAQQIATPKILSVGCSYGFEPMDLRRIIPQAEVLGCDVDADALAFAKTFCSRHKITVFHSSIKQIVEHGLYDVIVAMNVLALYPDMQDKEDISTLYPFSDFDDFVSTLSAQLSAGGYLLIYNSAYPFERSSSGALFDAVHLPNVSQNGWIDKYDEHGRRITVSEGLLDGHLVEMNVWRRWLANNDPLNSERRPYAHRRRGDVAAPDLKTVLWKKRPAET